MYRYWYTVGRSALLLALAGGLMFSSLPAAGGSAQTAPAPRVIFTYPAPREVIGPDATIQIAFDQPMDRASVEAAFSLEPALNGAFNWADDATLTFNPAGPLSRGETYRLTVDTAARSAAGVPLAERFRLTFEVAPNLSVNQVIPAPGAEAIEAGATITVVFDRPVVPLVTTGAQADLPQPLTLTPAVEGTGEWVGTAIYVFRPARALAGGTLYTATVSADLRDVDGSPMSGPYTWQFRTIPPQVLSTSPFNAASRVRLESPIRIDFNQPMDRASTAAAFTLRNAVTGADVAGALSFEDDDRRLVFTPASPLQLETMYQVSILGSARSASGEAALTNPQTLTFTTVPYPRVVRTYPRDGERIAPGGGASIEFNTEMDQRSFAGKVRVEPPPERLSFSGGGSYLSIDFQSQPAMTYTITLEAGALDRYGNPIRETTTFRFHTEDLRAGLNVAMRGDLSLTSAYRPDTTILAVTTNISSVQGRLATLSINDLLSLSTQWGYMNLRDWVPQGFTREWSQTIEAARNTRVATPINLASESGGQLAPGLYWVELDSPEFWRFLQPALQEPIRRILVVASTTLTVKQATDGTMLVWATDLRSGQPVTGAQIRVYDSAGQRIATGQTDAEGLVRLRTSARSMQDYEGLWVEATGEGLYGLSNTRWTDDVQPWAFDVSADYQPRQLAVYLYTDQPIYRPGRPVYFRGVVRGQDDVTFTIPQGERVEVTAYDPDGQERYRESLLLNAFGGFSGEFELPQGVSPGGGYIEAQFRGRTFHLFYTVAEFRPPEFLVSAAAERPEVAAGDMIRVMIDGTFLFGGPVSGARVTWQAQANQSYFDYTGEGSYDFSPSGGWVYDRHVAGGEGELDARGQFAIIFPADLGGTPVTQTFTIEASVTDISNQTVSGRTTVTVHPASVYVGLRPAQYVGTAERPLDVNVIVVDWDSQPQAGQRVSLTAVERRWEQNPTTLEWGQQRIPISEGTVVTDERGRAVFTFTPPRAGIYEVEASTRDSRERIASTSTTIWVQGRQPVVWDRDERSLTLVADRRGEYQPGETARILIPSPFPEPVQALITVERAGIMRTEIVTIEGSYTYELPLEAIHAPNVFVAVALVRGSGSGTADGSILPELRYGLLEIRVAVQQRLNVQITPSVERAEPGAEVRFDLLVTDLQGEPVVAEVGLSLTDLATLSVGEPNSAPIFDFFWSPRGLGVQTSSPLSRLIDGLRPADIAEQMSEDMMMRGGVVSSASARGTMTAPAAEVAMLDMTGGGGAPEVVVRTDFVDTPLWAPSVITGVDGRAQVSVTLPDNLTTWRLDARAITAETAVGDGTLDLISTRPLLVRPATPRFFVVGDETELAVVVNNNTGQDLAVEVSLQANGVTLRAAPRQTVNIAADGRVRVAWLATVEDVEAVDLTFIAVSGTFADASKPAVGIGPDRLLPVYRYLAPDIVATAGALREPGERTEGILLPAEALAPTGELTIRLSPSLAATTLDGLEYLRNFPYQCLEQTVSRFLPNVITLRALQQVGLDNAELRASLDDAIRYALERLTAEQKPDGGWGWYPADQSNLLTTAYALWGLIEARDADYRIDQTMINRALAFIMSRLSAAGQTTPYWELNRTAFALYVTARAGSPNVQIMESLFAVRERMSLYARALLAQTYDMSRGTPNAPDRIATLVSDLQSAAILSATGAYWEESARDWWNWGSDTRTTAIILDTLTRLMPEGELLPNVVRWLMVARRADAWETTQETAWAVMALTRWMVSSGELRAEYAYAVSLNGTQIGAGQATAETLRDTQTLSIAVGEMLREQINRLTFRHEGGPGALYYTATLQVNQPVEAIAPTDRGLRLARTYYLNEQPVTAARIGDVITVVLDITTTRDLHYIVINDPIPAGTEAIDRSLQTTAQIGEQPMLSNDDWRWRGWGWWWFSNTQIRSEKVVLSAQFLPRGTYRFVYQVQATTPGTYRVIPPHGNEFYFPEVFGRGAGSLFTVQP